MNLVTSFIIATTTHSKPLLPCFDYLLNLETANGQVLASRSAEHTQSDVLESQLITPQAKNLVQKKKKNKIM